MRSTPESGKTAIAIVGLGALYPGARTVHEFWNNIVAGVDSVTDIPDTHWSVADHYDPDPAAPDKTYSKRGGFIPPVEFDPLEFGLPPNTLEVTGVLQLLSLLVAKQTLADAGCLDSDRFDGSRIGVILGVTGANSLIYPLATRLQTPVVEQAVRACGLSRQDAEAVAAKFAAAFAPWQENSFPGLLGNVVAGRIANRFDLGGTNCTVDAACASSLAAVRMAVDELQSGRADLMITGGCDADNTILMYLCFSKTPAFSKRGRVRPFDEGGDGTLIGEGIGMLALKRLADAERDGDRIYAVLRGIGSSSDGRHKSIYAPRGEGQMVALGRAYADAGFGPGEVGLLEAHGTGTPVGDLTEVTALRSVYADAGRRSVAIGSVKSQIGHTKAAAGAAGLIKLALSLHHKVLPPTINVEKPRAALHFEDGPFYVNTESSPWIAQPQRPVRRAGVSSFGFGGTNFHCVLEEYGAAAGPGHATAQISLWHARDVAELVSALDGPPHEGPVPAEHARLAIVARGPGELAKLRGEAIAKLSAEAVGEAFDLPSGVYYRRRARSNGRVAALFAGQGSQYAGMGRAAALAVPQVQAAFDRAAAEFAGAEPLGPVVFPPSAFDEETRAAQADALRRTDFAQPAIAAISAGQFRYLADLGFVPDGALGHSFGELSALWAAGGLDDGALFRLARARGEAMARRPVALSDPGAMAVVHADRGRVEELLADATDVYLCNLNAPNQVVVGGGSAAVGEFIARCAAKGVGAKPLPVAAAFHTRYVEHAAEEFAAAVAGTEIRELGFPVYADTEGAEYGADPVRNRRVLTEQLRHPVAFAPRLAQMYDEGFRTFVEFGPKSVLTGLAGQTFADHADVVVLAADPGPGQDSDLALKRLAARLAVLGLPLTGFPPAQPDSGIQKTKKGMVITLTGVNHVPPHRERAYQEALTDGYTAADAAPPIDASSARRIAVEHLASHREYLASQSRVAEQIVAILRDESRNGMRDSVIAGINAIADHSRTIGRSHTQAGEVVRSMVHLEAGVMLPPVESEGPAMVTPPLRNEVYLPRTAPEMMPPAIVTPAAIASPTVVPNAITPAKVDPAAGVAVAPAEVAPAAHPGLFAPAGVVPVAEGSVPFAPTGVAPAAVAPGVFAPGGAVSAVGGPVVVASAGVASGGNAPDAMVPAAGAAVAVAPAADAAQPVGTAEFGVSPPPRGSGMEPRLTSGGSVAGSGAMDATVVRGQLLEIVSAKTGYPVDTLEGDMEIEADLGIDSIKRVEIMGALRERFPAAAVADADELAELRVLDNIVDFVVGGQEADVHPKGESGLGIARRHVRPSPLPAVDRLDQPFRQQPVALLAGEGSDLLERMDAVLTAHGWTVHRDEEIPETLDLVLYVPGHPADFHGAARQLREAVLLAARTQRALQSAARTGRSAFITLTSAAGTDLASAALSGVCGLVKTLAIEAPALFCRAIELGHGMDPATAAELTVTEIHDARTDLAVVRYNRTGARYTDVLSDEPPLSPPAAAHGTADPHRAELASAHLRVAECDAADPQVAEFGAGDLLVITGGGRGVTAACAVAVARRWRCGVLLLGRSESVGVEEISGTLAELGRIGVEARYLRVDVTDGAAVAGVLGPYRGRITGIVHGAGVLADQLIVNKRARDVDRVLGAKLLGLYWVLAATDQERVRHILLFSSVAGFFGNKGQVDYAVANEALNGVAVALKRARPDSRVTAINWGAWNGGMVTPELAKMFETRGVPLIPVGVGARMCAEQFARERGHDTVCVIGPSTPLSGSRPKRLSGKDVTVVRDLSAIARDPILADHCVNGKPVLPASAALGAILDIVGQVRPGRPVARLTEFTVCKGVVFDRDQPAALSVAISGDQVRVLDEQGRPRYQAVIGEQPAPEPCGTSMPPWDSGQPIDPYAAGELFHGPGLRGIRRQLTDTVFVCALKDVNIPGWSTSTYSPVLADLLLQVPLVWAHRSLGIATLPSRIGEIEIHRSLPDDAPFVVSLEDTRRTESGARCSAIARDTDGNVLLVFREIELVTRPAGILADRRLRLPAPPYLMISRVTELRAEAGKLEPASITVEYDVPADAWFAVDGRASFGPTLEIAQATLVLLGYQGIEERTGGERRFRLLGGSATFFEGLPRTGETLRYHVEITRFVWQGALPLIFFQCDGYRGDTLFLQMRDGCAGLFTDAELAEPMGVLDAERPEPSTGSAFTPLARSERTSLSPNDIERLTAGDATVFGAAYASDGHNPSIRLPGGDLLALDQVHEIDRTGGPAGLGRLVATQRVTPDAWYFACHFPGDPVLPGTMMMEGAAQLIQIYAMYLGLHLVFPDAEFQPALEHRIHCRLRGQVTPADRELRYVAEITSITMLPRPTVIADITVYDGDMPILSLRDLGIQVREKPGTPYRIERDGRPSRFLGRRSHLGEPTVAGELHMAHLAQGDLGLAMGTEFDVYQGRRAPRIPNGDFCFLHRLVEFTGAHGQSSGTRMITEYDSPPDAWYYTGNPGMPYCVLMETSLQSAVLTGYYLGASLLTPEEDLVIRNLDGRAVLLGRPDLRGRTIRQESELLSTHRTAGAILQSFRYRLSADGAVFYEGESLFGYFNDQALAKQSGLDGGRKVLPWLTTAAATAERITVGGAGRFDLIDDVEIVRDGGRYGLGYLRGRRRIDAGDWFFPLHFHGDPVMPGSLGVETVLQALRLFLRHTEPADPGSSEFVLPVDVPFTWRYRGQILPSDRELVFDFHVKEIRREQGRTVLIADANLWNNDLRIYEFTDIAVGEEST
ncbi:SDR family NAD(P)-dependent oxidoreductase [Nocardia sp. NPDC051832]|uniref:SDR family NAD(P)-dependent oxidoreductase n=1 Tax=Nocardia sp. NPDC051832 TaxID=3155673 RepID=UPI00341A7391